MPAPRWSHFLHRPTPAPDPALAAQATSGQRILITGAGGSIGAALARVFASAPHAQLTLLDHSEQALYELHSEFHAAPRVTLVLGNAGDPALLQQLFASPHTSPTLVVHAAAYKHVPLLQAQPLAAVQNNILRTQALLRVALPAAHFLLISTDKAAAPHSTMGATKRVAELLTLQAGANALRLANVLGSHGSVVPLFQQQLSQRLPLTVASPTATRYWMTEEEAVTAILHAICNRTGGLFLPPLGDPIPVLALARFLAAEAGRSQHPITFSGLRAGDKEHESLLGPGESLGPPNDLSPLHQVHIATGLPPTLHQATEHMRQAVEAGDVDRLRAILQQLCPTYQVEAAAR